LTIENIANKYLQNAS
ncbi:hypothetical protein A0P79_13810, partial [Salmonella enterica]|nr:hypothetical protein [Salmonella enterica]EBY9713818.1 hypothetical protein [Salmonella enterica subsp. enterica serovar Heidelberg]EDF6024272.1 hypothetical protein [Salmonella enterica subsp. enterica serovar Enteritidis]ECP3367998.1 hypothetical protein [Salmonella enterica]HAE6593725.1 hypothetical protein [Salmonella enterica]